MSALFQPQRPVPSHRATLTLTPPLSYNAPLGPCTAPAHLLARGRARCELFVAIPVCLRGNPSFHLCGSSPPYRSADIRPFLGQSPPNLQTRYQAAVVYSAILAAPLQGLLSTNPPIWRGNRPFLGIAPPKLRDSAGKRPPNRAGARMSATANRYPAPVVNGGWLCLRPLTGLSAPRTRIADCYRAYPLGILTAARPLQAGSRYPVPSPSRTDKGPIQLPPFLG